MYIYIYTINEGGFQLPNSIYLVILGYCGIAYKTLCYYVNLT